MTSRGTMSMQESLAHRRLGAVWLGRAIRALVLAGLLASAGCESEAEANAPLANAQESEEALVEAVLEALAREDREALQGFLVSREEYETLLWPQMPDSEHTTFDFVWGLNAKNSGMALGQMLSQYGGMQLELVELTFTSEPESYEDFTLHFDVQVKVRRTDTGDEGTLPSFDVFVEYEDVWKLLNYDEL